MGLLVGDYVRGRIPKSKLSISLSVSIYLYICLSRSVYIYVCVRECVREGVCERVSKLSKLNE